MRAVRLAAAAAAGLPGDRTRSGRRPWRSASSRRAAWSAISISSRASSATAAIPYLPENDAALDVLHWTGHTGCVILAPHLVGMREEGPGAAACERSHRAAAARRHVLDRRRRALQRRRRLQNHLPRRPRRDGHHHRRQLLRLLQEGSQDPDQLRRQPLRPVRGGARRRRDRLRHLCARPGVLRGPHRQPEEGRLRAMPCGCSATLVELQPEGYAVDRRYPDIYYVPEDAEFNVREGIVALATAEATARLIPCAPARPTSCPRASASRWRNSSAARPGGWSDRARAARFATSPAPSPAAASRKSPSRSPT